VLIQIQQIMVHMVQMANTQTMAHMETMVATMDQTTDIVIDMVSFVNFLL
jgi:hypothetical protein